MNEPTTMDPLLNANASPERKQGGRCCFFCCDYRTAVLVLSSINLVAIVYNLVTHTMEFGLPELKNLNGEISDELHEIFKERTNIYLAMNLLSFISTCISIAGAYFYSKCMVIVNILWVVVNVIVFSFLQSEQINEVFDAIANATSDAEKNHVTKLVQNQLMIVYFFVALFYALWLYPSVFFVIEVQKGILSKQTFDREHVCCGL